MRTIPFSAQWTRENCHLQDHFSDIVDSPYHTLGQKASLCFSRALGWGSKMLCYPAHQQARNTIVGGTSDTKELVQRVTQEWVNKWEGDGIEHALLRDAYEPIIIQGKDPNGDSIKGTFYRSKCDRNDDLPTILCPNPNLGGLSLSEGWDWLLRKGAKSDQPFNVIVFDYASAANQGGSLDSPRNLILNADTFYQFAQNQGVSESNIHFFGFCSGTQVMASLAALHPNSGKLVSLNASYNLAELIYRSPFTSEEMEKQQIRFIPLMKKVVHLYLSWSRWAMDIRSDLNKISHRTLFLHHHEDRFVSPDLRCTQVVTEHLNTSLLKTKNNVKIEDKEYVTHWLPIFLTQDEQGLSGSKKVVNFILGKPVFHPREKASSIYTIKAHKNGLKDIQKVKQS
jgi:pimeloyl-ACP methyl ester carboxylesterase